MFCRGVGYTITHPSSHAVNVYDLRRDCTQIEGPCYELNHLSQLFNSEEYRELIGIPQGHKWYECSKRPWHPLMMYDHDSNWGYKLAPLLDAGIPVLIYSGDQDYICNWFGGLAWTSALVWDG